MSPKHLAITDRETVANYHEFQKDFRKTYGEAPLDYEFHLWQKQKDQLSL